MRPRIALNIIGIILLYNILAFYIGWRIWTWIHTFMPIVHFIPFMIIIGVIAYSYFIARLGHHFTVFKIIGSYWIALFQYAIILFPLAELANFILTFASMPENIRVFWVGTMVVCLLVTLLLYGTFNAYSPVIRNYSIKVDKKVAQFKKLRIAVASDMHFGTLSGLAHLRRLVKNMNTIAPDLILLPGDIIDDEPEAFIRKKMDQIMKEMGAPLGIYGVLGNHEYYGGKIPEFIELMDSIEVKILTDETVLVMDSFYIIGRKDRTEKHRMSIEELVNDLDLSLPLIMMDHQPYRLDQAAAARIDILLSGHTHRGQMAPNHLITKKIFELDWGYLLKDKLHVFVSSGFGFWGPPIRIGSRSEILVIDVEFA